MSIFLYAAGAAGFCAAAALCRKGFAWDPKPRLRQAQKEERDTAPAMVGVLCKYFVRLDLDGDGLLRPDAHTLASIDHLGASEREMNLLQTALESTGPRWHSFVNPWLFGPFPEYTYEPIGHLHGTRKMDRLATSQFALTAFHYEVEVEDWAISLVDISTYVSRVNRRQAI